MSEVALFTDFAAGVFLISIGIAITYMIISGVKREENKDRLNSEYDLAERSALGRTAAMLGLHEGWIMTTDAKDNTFRSKLEEVMIGETFGYPEDDDEDEISSEEIKRGPGRPKKE